jgi:phenylalanyl-tRNA synthetase beta chain
MGGSRSEVGDDSTRVLLEAASWDGATVQRTGVALGVRSEASARFEKGLSRLSPLEGQAVASALLIELCGARLLPGTVDVGGPGPESPPLRLRPQRVAELLGTEIPPERCAEILGSLGFAVGEDLEVGVPHWRTGDVTREIDLIEEVARIDGLERLPATLPPRRGVAGRLTHAQRLRRRAEDALAARGVSEIAGWTFTDPVLLDRLRLGEDHPMRRVLRVRNPLSESLSLLRPTLLGSLLDAAAHNAARDAGALALFESGTVFRASAGVEGLADEHHGLAVLLCGGAERSSWRAPEPSPADFYAAKALLEAVLEVAGVDWQLGVCDEPFLHPGASASVGCGEVSLGFIGEVHPLVCQAWELERAAFWAIDLGRLASVAPEVAAYRPFGEFPAVREDLAVVVAEGVSAAAVIDAVRSAGGASLASVEVFDVYRGAQVGEGRLSLALHLEFRASDRTLTDEDVAAAREKIAAALRSAVGGELRA